MIKKILIALATCFGVFLATGCTDADVASWKAIGNEHHVVVYQFSDKIYDGISTGKITEDRHHVKFMDKNTHELVSIQLGQSATVVTKVLAN